MTLEKGVYMENINVEQELADTEKYLRGLEHFQKFYLTLVVMASATVCIGIVIALFAKLFIGIALALISACLYMYFSADEARKSLGIRYNNTDGHIVITSLQVAYGSTLVVPDRFIYADVRAIADGALANKKNSELVALYLPRSIEKIGQNIFSEGQSITVYYEGTPEEWDKIHSKTDFSGQSILFECELPRLPKKQKNNKKSSHADNDTHKEEQ